MLEPVLIIVYPPERHRIISIPEGKSIIGRGIDADIRLDDSLVSRKHAEISREGTVISIKDMNSTNGTFVNCTEISAIQLELASEIELGTTILKFKLHEENSVEKPLPGLTQKDFESYAKSIEAFSTRNHLPLAMLYIKCHAQKPFTQCLESKIASLILKGKRPNDLFMATFPEEESIEFALLVPHLSRQEAIEETCSIRDAIETHKFSINEQPLCIDPKFGFAFADEAVFGICNTLFEDAKNLADS